MKDTFRVNILYCVMKYRTNVLIITFVDRQRKWDTFGPEINRDYR